tara:strand:- start:925 stop:1614 length:690 start_codon:yes stop_codon:yes gene_type:complete
MKSKRYKNLIKAENDKSSKSIKDLLAKIKKNCTAKFDETIDLSLQINNKQKKGEVNIRTVVNMPSGTGKKIKVAVVCDESKKASAEKAGADIVGGDDLIAKIKAGELNFDKIICTPKMMINLSKLGKILGPKGLMPNPKLGTVTENIEESVKNAKAGQVEVKNDKDGNIGVSIGKKSFTDDKILSNFNAIIETLEKEKGNNPFKGEMIKNIYLTSTMGISYKLKLDKHF